jgi:hypothetical protein
MAAWYSANGRSRSMAQICARVLCVISISLASRSAGQTGGQPVPMELRHNWPFVQVTINGKGPFTFGIDTGAGGEALISSDLIEKLHLPVTGETETSDPMGNNPQKVPTVTIDSLKVAGVEFKNVAASRFQPLPMEGGCDGILGFPLFREYLLTLDYPRQQLTITSGSIAQDGGSTVLPFTMPDSVPLVELQVGSQEMSAHLDSRGMGLSIPEKFAQGLRFISDPVPIGRGRTVSNDFEIKGAQLASDVRLAGYTFPEPFVEINPVFPVANLGSIPLRNFAVTFDQKNKLVRFVSPNKIIKIAPPRMRMQSPEPHQ